MASIWRRQPASRLSSLLPLSTAGKIVASEFFEPPAGASLRGVATLTTGSTADLSVVAAALLTGTASMSSSSFAHLVTTRVAGLVGNACRGGADPTPELSVDLWAYSGDWWPFGASDTQRSVMGSLTSDWPVSTTPVELTGWIARHYADDFYHRIHMTPRKVEFGNIATAQAAAIEFWNAYLVPRTLIEITASGNEGINLDGAMPPVTMAPLSLATYTITVTPDGPPAVAATYTWKFEDEQDLTVHLTATRIIPWGWLPDWAGGVREELAWLTTVLAAPTGDEQRRAMRLSPRRTLDAAVIVQGRERQFFDLAMWGWGARVFAVPLWHDIQMLTQPVEAGAFSIPCETAHREFSAGGLALLRGTTAFETEVAEIEEVGPTEIVLRRPLQRSWARGARLYPAVMAELATAPATIRITDQASTTPITFRVMGTTDYPASPPATLYRDWPVLELRPEESEDLTNSMQRLLLELDNLTGRPVRTDTAGQAFVVQSHRFVPYQRAAHAALRGLLYFLQGRFTAMWVPTFADDVTLVEALGDSSVSMVISNIEYARFGGRPGRRDLRIELRNGAAYHVRILGGTAINADTESLELAAPVGVTITPGNVRRISWLQLCRLDHDQVEFLHETDAAGIGKCQIVLRGVRDDV